MADVDALNEAALEVTLRLDGGPDDCLGTHSTAVLGPALPAPSSASPMPACL